MRLALFLATLSLLGCGSAPITVGLDHRHNDEQRLATEWWMIAWNHRTNAAHQFAWTLSGDPDVFVLSEVPYRSRDGADDGANGRFYRRDGVIRVRPGLPIVDHRRVIGHEFGHVLMGPEHVDGPGLMAARGEDVRDELTAFDLLHCINEGACDE